MNYTAEIGRLGEGMIADFLRKKGYIIARKNYHSKFGEIDIVAESREYILFVEVKTRRRGSLASPAEAVSKPKQKRIVLTAYNFLSKLRLNINYRFDVAEIFYEIDRDGEVKVDLNYIENAFTPEVLDGEPF